ncbi:hypothetical protein [Mesobacterium pallidum]|uniref:hypothetical protein n=1 Tax=Mesobacterium pallidum TaxID=2872037 RepID=UPI001EE31360|nr:hypothetical protein [Mesobacterium pallidum]
MNASAGSADLIAGQVERADAAAGIIGWAVDLGQPERVLTLRLLAGGHEIATTPTAYVRDDIDRDEGIGATDIGFRFDPVLLEALAALPESQQDAALAVEVAGTGFVLPSASPLPTAGALLAQLRGAAARAGSGPAGGDDGMFEALLAEGQTRAAAADPGGKRRQVGHIEMLRRLDKGHLFIAGWLSEVPPRRQAGVLAQGPEARHGAAVALATFPRDDLPDGAKAFVGLLRTDWRAARGHTAFTVTLRPGDEPLYLAASDEVGQPSRDDLRAWVDSLASRAEDPAELALVRARIGRPSGWTPTPAEDGARLQIDNMLMVPGSGVFMRGWILNGSRRITDVQVRAGDAIARADMRSFYRYPRKDLTSAFAWAGDEVKGAGFTCFLRGPLDADLRDAQFLRIRYDDGTEQVQTLDTHGLRVLAAAQGAERLADFYPQLHVEPFFAEDQAQMRRMLARSLRVRPLDGALPQTPAPALVLQLGNMPQDIDIVMHGLAGQAAAWPSGARIVALCDPETPRTRFLVWQQELRARGLGPVLPVMGCAGHGLPQLAQVAALLPSSRLAFLKPGTVPRPEGWARICAWLAGTNPTAPQVLTTNAPRPGGLAEREIGALLWHAQPLAKWAGQGANAFRFSEDYAAAVTRDRAAEIAPDTVFAVPRVLPSLFVQRLDLAAAPRTPETADG